jgi:hypothetical protein
MASTVLRVEFEAATAGLKRGAQEAIGIMRGTNAAIASLQGMAGAMLSAPILQAAEALAQYREEARSAGRQLASRFSPEMVQANVTNRLREMEVGRQLAERYGAQFAEQERRKKEQELGLTALNAGAPKTLAEQAMYGLQNPTRTLSEGFMASGELAASALQFVTGGDQTEMAVNAVSGIQRLRRAFGLGESSESIAGETEMLRLLRDVATNTQGAR